MDEGLRKFKDRMTQSLNVALFFSLSLSVVGISG